MISSHFIENVLFRILNYNIILLLPCLHLSHPVRLFHFFFLQKMIERYEEDIIFFLQKMSIEPTEKGVMFFTFVPLFLGTITIMLLIWKGLADCWYSIAFADPVEGERLRKICQKIACAIVANSHRREAHTVQEWTTIFNNGFKDDDDDLVSKLLCCEVAIPPKGLSSVNVSEREVEKFLVDAKKGFAWASTQSRHGGYHYSIITAFCHHNPGTDPDEWMFYDKKNDVDPRTFFANRDILHLQATMTTLTELVVDVKARLTWMECFLDVHPPQTPEKPDE